MINYLFTAAYLAAVNKCNRPQKIVLTGNASSELTSTFPWIIPTSLSLLLFALRLRSERCNPMQFWKGKSHKLS